MQADFYLSKEDKLGLAELIFSKGARLVPSLHYDSERYIELCSVKDYEEYVDRNILMHIIHPSFSKMNLEFDSFEKDGKKVFYLLQRYGGPTVDFYSSGKIFKDGVNYIGSGFISIFSYYWKGKEKIQATEHLKSFYKGLSSHLKSHSNLIKYSKRVCYVGSGAAQLVLQGYKIVSLTDEMISGLILDNIANKN